MSTFDRIKKLADKQKISIMELEEKLGLGRNSLYGWKRKVPNGANLEKAADYFNVSVDYLLGRTDKKQYDDSLTEKDEKDIAKRMAKVREDLLNNTGEDGLSFMGEPISDEAKDSLLDALEFIERQTTTINKKYIPKGKRN